MSKLNSNNEPSPSKAPIFSHSRTDDKESDYNVYRDSTDLNTSSPNKPESSDMPDKNHAVNSELISDFNSSGPSNGNDFSRMNPGQIYSHLQEKLRTIDNVDNLILSNITLNDELNSCDHQSNSNQYNYDNKIESSKFENSCFSDCTGEYDMAESNPYAPLNNLLADPQLSVSSARMISANNVEESHSYVNPKGFALNKHNSHPNENPQHKQMKNKLKTMWNNVKYGWRVKREVNLKLDSQVWLLGQCYHNKLHDSSVLQNVSNQFKLDLLSKIWLTYRINFPTIPGTDLISDSGWGCMLRCGQMMMAQAMVFHFLQRDWRLSQTHSAEVNKTHKMILRWFGDSNSDNSPFSLHHLVLFGESYGRKAGDWYGPTHAAQVLRDALIQAKRNHSKLQSLHMYVALDGIVFKQDVMDLCSGLSDASPSVSSSRKTFKSCEEKIENEVDFSLPRSHLPRYSNPETGHFNMPSRSEISYTDPCPSYSQFGPPSFSSVEDKDTSLILFVSVRLGNDKINPFYIPCLKSLLAYQNCIGIIGGRPKHALYFIGWQDDKLIHMDPHTCQAAVDVDKDDFSEKTFHTSSVRTMPFQEMDPSCAIGFYFRRRQEFDHFVHKFSEITAPMKRNLDYPVFALAEGKRTDVEDVDAPLSSYTRSSVSFPNSKTDDDDDYILL